MLRWPKCDEPRARERGVPPFLFFSLCVRSSFENEHDDEDEDDRPIFSRITSYELRIPHPAWRTGTPKAGGAFLHPSSQELAMKLSVCICTVFKEVDFPDRIGRVKDAGLPAFEFWGWSGVDLDAVERAKQETGLELAALCVDSADPEVKQGLGGGSLVNPECRDAFVSAAKETIAVAQRLGAPSIIATVGNEQAHLTVEEQHQSIIDGMKAVAPAAEDAGVTFVIEPLNTLVNHAGYYLSSSAEGFDICRAVASPAVKLLFDIYHQQITEGNLIQNITENIELVGHVHSADVPGRHQFGTGEINYANVLAAIAATDYPGYIGLEYTPTGDSAESLEQIKEIVGVQ
jgi:hydroxypyruvate isomerase